MKTESTITETITIEKTCPDRAWEGCINSVNYRVQRGVPVAVPQILAEHIRATQRAKQMAAASAERLSHNGKRGELI